MHTMYPFTVVAVTAGDECYRENLHVHALNAKEAVAEALGQLNDELSEKFEVGTKTHFIAAAVFEGHLFNAHGWATGGCADDRFGRVRDEHRTLHFHPFTVVGIDPVTRKLCVHHLIHAASGNAERNAKLDFMLIAETLEGHHPALYVFEGERSPQAQSTREERIRAMAKYSKMYLRYLGTNRPIHEPLPD